MKEESEFNQFLRELDSKHSRITVRLEIRRFRKPVTVIQGLPKHGKNLPQIARNLKQKLATGGTAKDGLIILQGDHRQRVRDELLELGFSEDLVEVHR